MLPAADASAPPIRVVVAGHVDHGKSTLLGQLMLATGAITPKRLAELQSYADRRGVPLELSFALDALQAERDQAVTIDVSQIRLRGASREIVIVDAPGHVEFLKNMVSGASSAEAAVLVVDAVEGVREQTRRHAYLLRMLGIVEVAVAVNKMDLVGYREARFVEVASPLVDYLGQLGLTVQAVVPVSARLGDTMIERSPAMPWYEGPALLAAMEAFAGLPRPGARPLRFPVQDVYRVEGRRIVAGRVEAGVLRAGDALVFSPSNRQATVRSLEAWGDPAPVEAHAGSCVGLTLAEPVFVDRGEIASHAEQAPALSTVFRTTLFWLSGRPLREGAAYRVRVATREAPVTVERIESAVDLQTLQTQAASSLERHGVGKVVFRSAQLLALDDYARHPATGRCVLVDDQGICGGGLISLDGFPDQRLTLTVRSTNVVPVQHRVTRADREHRSGHRGGVLWLTGLPASGKSTLAMAVEERLFREGYQVYVLDGDNIRTGINADLGFSPGDRAENIRRIGEVASLFADAGFICLAAFISPYRSERDRARRAVAEGRFHEIYVKADLATCERRDPKGLYRRARQGELQEFTGVSAPYEPPLDPELTVETDVLSVDASVDRIVGYVQRKFVIMSREL